MRRSIACLPTRYLGTLRLPYERAGQIFEILFQETRHVGGYRNEPAESCGAGKTLQRGAQAGLSAGSECRKRNVAGSIAAGFFQCPAECKQPIKNALCGHYSGPQSLSEPAVLLPRPGAEFVRRQERDRPVLQVSPGPFGRGGNRIADGGEFEQLLRRPEPRPVLAGSERPMRAAPSPAARRFRSCSRLLYR
jgi:hypothetical protein